MTTIRELPMTESDMTTEGDDGCPMPDPSMAGGPFAHCGGLLLVEVR